jgi:hypothetical protein
MRPFCSLSSYYSFLLLVLVSVGQLLHLLYAVIIAGTCIVLDVDFAVGRHFSPYHMKKPKIRNPVVCSLPAQWQI